MSRFFGGMGKKGGSGTGNKSGGANAGGGISDKNTTLLSGIKSESLQKAMKYQKKGSEEENRYQQLIKEKFESNKSAFMMNGPRSGANRVSNGKEAEQGPSKATMATMEKLAMKMAKQQMKKDKKRDPVAVKSGYLSGMTGGYIDKKGRIFNAYNQQVLQIDLKSGKIKTVGLFGGSAIGKYDPNSTFCMYKIEKKIQEFNVKKGHGNNSIWGDNGSSSIYGTPPTNNGGGWDGNGW